MSGSPNSRINCCLQIFCGSKAAVPDWSEIGEYYVDHLKQIGSEVTATLLYPIDHVTVEMPTIDWEEAWTDLNFNIAFFWCAAAL